MTTLEDDARAAAAKWRKEAENLAAENARLRQQRNKAERTVAQAVRVVHDLRALLDGERVPQGAPSEPKPQGCDDLCVRLSGVGLHPNVPGRVLCDCGAIITSAADVPVICACGKRHEPNPTEGDTRP